jgi:CTP synthase
MPASSASPTSAGLAGANSTEADPNTPHPVIDLLPEQREIEDKGATMRLGNWPCVLKPGTRAHKAYGTERIAERHRHRYEFNPEYRQVLEQEAGLVVSGTSPDGRLVEIVEVADHPWFVACQFHPEFASTPFRPSPLFVDFIAAARKRAVKRESFEETDG